MMKGKDQQALDTETFKRIRKWYLLALAGIALTIVVAQILIQLHLNSQLNDSRVINIAGRQRAYSQKLVKEVLLLDGLTENNERDQILSEIQGTLKVWEVSHQNLKSGTLSMSLSTEQQPRLNSLFNEIDPHFKAMSSAVESLINEKNSTPENFTEIKGILLENERSFLQIMDDIVNEYDERSKEKLQNLKQKEYFLLVFSLGILLLEMLFIFKPLSIQIGRTISNLLRTKNESDLNSKRVETLLVEKEKSLQELQELNFIIDNAALFASARKDGSVVFISKKFLELLGLSDNQINKPISEILTVELGQQQYLKEVFKSTRKNIIRSEELKIKTIDGSHFWLDMSIVPIHQSSTKHSILILCSDITERKQNQLRIEELTKQNFEERMLQKKMQASQIVEGQEEERKRISKDIHDGIGQMLTALRFNIESIDVNEKGKTGEKIEYLKSLTADLIKGVRTATFNLTPPELKDHGVFPALHKMTIELSKLTGKTILFENRTEDNIRFDSLAETNIYRVTQEAVNNAIKYAQANYILVTINFKEDVLSVVIDDDGKGFDTSILGKAPKNNSEGGMGLFFMKERISYINGRLFINSELGKGTRVTINYKTNKEKVLYGA
ncbi:ATP-binding protein [Maribacter sp. CXY002]|uniref:sensor histidine kinase n=1 Tax=Maribacter luteocoastalis TaxID=3407671 RepID=UPI003B6856EB